MSVPINYDTDGQILMAVQRYFEPEHGLPEDLEDDLRRLDDAHAATVAALEERVAELEGLLRDVEITEVPIQNGTVDVVVFGLVEGKGKYEATNDWAERVRSALAPTEEGGRDA